MRDGLVIAAAASCLPEERCAWDDWALSDVARAADGEYVRVHLHLLARAGVQAAAASAALRPYWDALRYPADGRYARERRRTQSELALAATMALWQGCPDAQRDCGLAIYSGSSIDEDLVLSVPCRLIAEAGLTRAHAFALGQNQGADFFQALTVAQAFFHTDATLGEAVLVAGEKWLAPFPRLYGASACHADGAVALRLRRGDGTGPGLHLLDHVLRPFEADEAAEAAGGTDPLAQREQICRDVVATVAALLARHAVRAADIALVLAPGLRGELLDAVAGQLHFTAAQQARPDDSGYLAAADTPYRLERLLRRLPEQPQWRGALVLAWGVGLGGCCGAALFRVGA